MMCSTVSTQHVFFCLILLFSCSVLVLRFNLHRIPFNLLRKDSSAHCFERQSIKNQFFTEYRCPNYSQMNSLVWTYDGTGLMKYIQWIVTRKLANIRITRLNNYCRISQENDFSSNPADDMLVQIYILSLSANLIDESECSKKISQIAYLNVGRMNHIYFKRKSTKATIIFQQLDSMTHNHTFTFDSDAAIEESIEKAYYITNRFSRYFASIPSIKWTLINSEDLIKADLIECEKVLTNFLSLLGLRTSTQSMGNMIEYDSHRFIEDATWWDQSVIAKHILDITIPPRPLHFTYSNDFYYLHGDRSFTQYLFQTRQCYTAGIFDQMQSKTITNRSSTDTPERCSSKPFDCAFSDIYSFSDREQIYQQFHPKNCFNDKTIKCAFTIPSIFDKVRHRYSRNQTCQTIIFTCVTNCYDPLPGVKGEILPSFCFVALLDTKTITAYKKMNLTKLNVEWDMIDLGTDATPFSVAAKSTETMKIVGERMFPLAKWIIWLDGKARINDIIRLLLQARAPFIGAHHPDFSRTSASEVDPTIGRLRGREAPLSQRLNNSITDIRLQEKEYRRDGFYNHSDALKLKMYESAVFLYRNNHPCISRYLCGWHNEVNYYSYRGQLSVYYAAVRLNLTDYLHFLPGNFYSSVGHQAVC